MPTSSHLPRRLAALLALVAIALATAFVAGCGGDDDEGSGNARGEVLSYFPEDAGVVGLIATDPNGGQVKQALELVRRFPASGTLLDRLREQVEEDGVDYEKDVKPMLGNELAVGAGRSGKVEDQTLLVAFVSRDQGKLENLVEKSAKEDDAESAGEHQGAKLYSNGEEDNYALKGSTVLLGNDLDVLKEALDRAEDDEGLAEETYDENLGDLSKDSLFSVTGDVRPLLADPGAAQARKIPWIAALRKYATTIRATDDRLVQQFRLQTEGDVAEEDVPLATGDEAPEVPGAPIGAGIRDLAHVIHFAQRAARAVDPQGYSQFNTAKAAIRSRYRVDIDKDVVDQLSGQSSVAFEQNRFAIRSELKDPDAMKQTLERLEPAIPSFLRGAGLGDVTVRSAGEDSYRVLRGGEEVAAYRVDGEELVVSGSATGGDELDASAGQAIAGSKGALAVRVTRDFIADIIGAQVGSGVAGRLALGALGDTTGWVSASPDELTGEVRVDVRE